MGDAPADLILADCSLFSVYTGEVLPGMQVAITGERIAYVGPDASHARGPATKVIDVRGRHVGPGFADPHVHIDQFVMPSEFAREALLCGVTSLFSDPIDMVSVAGYRGFVEFLRMGRNLPIRIFQTVPGGLPVDPEFSSARNMTAREQAAVRKPDVPGMGEVFSWTKVTGRDERTMRSISAMLGRGCIVNGHTAGASGRKLGAYAASGIMSCHEPIDFGQVLERLRLGMWVMIREGSIRRDLGEIISRVVPDGGGGDNVNADGGGGRAYLDRLMFCSDGLDPSEIRRFGYMDHCVQQAVGLGMRPVDAIAMATRHVFDYYNMSGDLGGIAPGRLADILVFGDIGRSFRPEEVIVGGRTVVSGGRLAVVVPDRQIPWWLKRTVRVPRLSARDFEVRIPPCDGGREGQTDGGGGAGAGRGAAGAPPAVVEAARANTILLKTEIITAAGSADLDVDADGLVTAPEGSDVWKVAAFDRVHGNRDRRCVGFLEGFGGSVGALGSTWSFHENDMIIIGSDDAAMARVANHLIYRQGGVAVVQDGAVAASMPLQLAGIVSTAPFERVLGEFEEINRVLADSGCRLERPVLVPLFLPFLALPAVRITSGGIVDVKRREYVDPLRPDAA